MKATIITLTALFIIAVVTGVLAAPAVEYAFFDAGIDYADFVSRTVLTAISTVSAGLAVIAAIALKIKG